MMKYELGVYYYNVINDYKEAVEWFTKSAEQDDIDDLARFNLGLCYERGRGVVRDYRKAIGWYREVAGYFDDICHEMAVGRIETLTRKIIEESMLQTNGHEYVDLGLPSGLLWATCNVGAKSPEEYGDYYAWGEVMTKNEYTKENYETNYDKIGDISGNAQYDVARKKWGGTWRIPTSREIEELLNECKIISVEHNGIVGERFIGPNGNSIFIPAAGYRRESLLFEEGDNCCYWSSVAGTFDVRYCNSLVEEICDLDETDLEMALSLDLNFVNECYIGAAPNYRSDGLLVRPVIGGDIHL